MGELRALGDEVRAIRNRPLMAKNTARAGAAVTFAAAAKRVRRQAGYRTGLIPQIPSAYSRMLRSLEKGPMLSVLMTALRLHASWST